MREFGGGKKNIPEPEKVIISPQNETANSALSGVEGWQTYKNEEYGFEFQYPPACGGEGCKINTEPFNNEVFRVGRASLSIENLGELTLSEYVYNIFPKEWETAQVEETDGSQYLKETFVESRENITIGGREAIRINYRFGGMGRFGTDTFIEKDKKVFIFSWTVPGTCCDDEVYDAMLSTFRFVE